MASTQPEELRTEWREMSKIKTPTYNMSETRLRDSIELGKKILAGEVDLVQLNNESLGFMGKVKGISEEENGSSKMEKPVQSVQKRTRDVIDEKEEGAAQKKKQKIHPVISPFFPKKQEPGTLPTTTTDTQQPEDMTPYLKKIALSQKTPFTKRVLTLLCQVPRGQYTTYGAMSRFLSSSPRAVGNALRNNPFAPMVPCHRVLASGGGIGGFMGSWGRGGSAGVNDGRKRELLKGEGIKFDGHGQVVGEVWEGFR